MENKITIEQFLGNYLKPGKKGLTKDELKRIGNDPAVQEALDDNGKDFLKRAQEDNFFAAVSNLDGSLDRVDLQYLSIFNKGTQDKRITSNNLDIFYENFPHVALDQLFGDIIHFKGLNNKDEQSTFTPAELKSLSDWLKGNGKTEDLLAKYNPTAKPNSTGRSNPARSNPSGTTASVLSEGENQRPYLRIKNTEKLNPEIKQKMAQVLDSLLSNMPLIDTDGDGRFSFGSEIATLINNDSLSGLSVKDISEYIKRVSEQNTPTDSETSPLFRKP